jgi:heptosyltransferase-2
MRTKNFRKIMVRATNWIGDGVMSLAALEALREQFPSAEIVLVSKPWVSELYWHLPSVTRQIIYNPAKEHKGSHGFWKLARQLQAEKFDAAVLLQNAFHAAWMAWCARVPVRIGYARDSRSALLTDAVEPPPPAAYGHQAYYYLQLLFRAGLIDRYEPVRELRLTVTEPEKEWARRHLARNGLAGPRFLVGIHPGAFYGPAKRWLLERYAQVADRLIGALHADVLIFGSAAERPLAEEIARGMKHTPLVLSGTTSLRQLMALLGQCRVVITNDSGPMHLGAALGLPVVAVFGSTDERATGPIGPRTRVVKRPVECSPCGLRVCPIDLRCMKSVTVDDVYVAALGVLKEAA